jgi:glycogen(starch) synthase
MSKALFLITELHKPVGGLYRFTTELLPAWRAAFARGECTYEPLVLSVRDPRAPLGDLRESKKMKAVADGAGVEIFEAVRGGETCYFIDKTMDGPERNDFHKLLWDKYRIQSEKASGWADYAVLNTFWKYAPIVATALVKEGEKISVIDAQDWLAFPAGFLCAEALGKALNCRFHSGEFGRSLGNPDLSSAPVQIERAALQEADFVQGVSVGEAKFELYHLLPLKNELYNQLKDSRSAAWREEQEWKTGLYEEFLLLESEGLELLGRNAGGLPNGIIIDGWDTVTKADVKKGRKALERLLPGKKKYVLFIGRAEYRKGIDHLLEAFALLGDKDTGLIISSVLSEPELNRLLLKASNLGIAERVRVSNGWLDEEMKKPMFCAAEVIALPSLYEPFGIVTLEGLAADLACEKNGLRGPAVIVGDTGGMREVIKNGVNGFKVPLEEGRFDMNPAFMAKILSIVLTNEEIARNISKGGGQRVMNPDFNWEHVATRVSEIYKRAIANHAKWEAALRVK